MTVSTDKLTTTILGTTRTWVVHQMLAFVINMALIIEKTVGTGGGFLAPDLVTNGGTRILLSE